MSSSEWKVIVEDGELKDEAAFLAMGGTIDENGRLDYVNEKAYRQQEMVERIGHAEARRITQAADALALQQAEVAYSEIMEGYEEDPSHPTTRYTGAGKVITRGYKGTNAGAHYHIRGKGE